MRVEVLAAKYRDQPIESASETRPRAQSRPRIQAIAGLDFDEARRTSSHAIGPLKVAQAFMPQVAASKRRLVIAMSSDSGSLEASFKQPVLYHYKASKAALNMYFHTLAFEAPRKGVTVVMLHPGTVKTSPAMERFPGAMDTPVAVEKMLAVIKGLGPADNGRFMDFKGDTCPGRDIDRRALVGLGTSLAQYLDRPCGFPDLRWPRTREDACERIHHGRGMGNLGGQGVDRAGRLAARATISADRRPELRSAMCSGKKPMLGS